MTPTPQQEALYEAVAESTTHVVAEAVAGAGKTTVAVQCAALGKGGKTGFIAFNRHIVEELSRRLDGTASAKTLHGLGYAACKRAFPCEVEEGKPKRLLQKIRPQWAFKGKRGAVCLRPAGTATVQLARLAKYTLAGIHPDASAGPGDLAALAEAYGVEVPEDDAADVLAAVPDLMEEAASETRTVDFDDMVWLPTALGLPVERFDLLLTDEAQDLSKCQHALALAACDGGRMVIVGDTKQAIMSFAGSDADSFPRLARHLGGTARGAVTRPLTVTFRCPTSHVALAQRLVPHIEAAPGAVEGEVLVIDPGDVRLHVTRGDLVLSRRNAPLLSLAFQLMGAGVPVMVRGRDLGAGLLGLIEGLGGDDVVQLLTNLEDWRGRELEKLERKDAPESSFCALEDRAKCLKELAAGAPTVAKLAETVRNLFGDTTPEGKVVLSSVHRAKGLEADRVVLIDTESIPLVRSCRACRGRGCGKCEGRGTRTKPWEFTQELNLAYVAITRAKKCFVFAGPVPAIFGGNWS